ncbi:MAG TPA: hypothetical protein VHZ25_14530 [Acidobacteriaceae bacterium]|nr:hypothetical protein [Acidobacteriaceae bacterium]
MENPIPNRVPMNQAQQAAQAECHSDSHIIMGLGIVLLCFGAAITGHREVTMIGLAMIVFSNWLD